MDISVSSLTKVYGQQHAVDDTVDTENIEATMENGVLSLKLGMKEHAKPRKIEVKSK